MPKDRHAYILVIPSLFTTGNLFCGFFSIVRSFNHDFEKAAYAIILAGIFDVLDGRVARITQSTSKFGVEYDSIADVVSFGVAPALLAYVWLLSDYGNVGWAAAFFFAACGALRLARFNTIAAEGLAKSFFLGLPIPAAANFVASLAIAQHEIRFSFLRPVVLVVMFLLGTLMVSSIRYRTFKDFDLRHRRSFFQLVLLVSVVAVAAVRPEVTLMALFGCYVLWGPVLELFVLIRRNVFQKKSELKTEVHEPVGKES